MLLLRCDARTVYAAVVVVAATLLVFALLRAAVHLLGALVTRATQRFMNPLFERLACTALCLVAVVVFADGSALLPALVLLAAATAAAFCRSLRSFRWLWLSSFTFNSLVLLNVVGPLLALDVDVEAREWSALVRRQHVLVPSLRDEVTRTLSLTGGTTANEDAGDFRRFPLPSRYVYAFFDSVRIEGAASPLVVAAVRGPKLSVDVASWLHRVLGETDPAKLSARNTSAEKGKRRKAAVRKTDSDAVPTQHVIASGDDTLLTHYGEAADAGTAGVAVADEIVLVGERSSVEHSFIHCFAYPQNLPSDEATAPVDFSLVNATRTRTPCLQLHATTRFRNVTIYWAPHPEKDVLSPFGEASIRWHAFQAGREREQSCVEVRDALTAQLSASPHRAEGTEGTGEASESAAAANSFAPLLECVEELDVARLPQSFVAAAPFPVRFGWHFPGYLRRVQEAFFLLADRVIVPFGFFLADALNFCGAALSTLLVRFGSWFVDVLPHVKHAAEEAYVYTGGLVCGSGGGGGRRDAAGGGPAATNIAGSTSSASSAAPSPFDSALAAQAAVLHGYAPAATGCAAFARTHATHAAFRAGAQTRKSALAVLSTLADALDLFPGVWSVVRWAWEAELAITLRILEGVRAAGHVLFFVLPRPLWHVLREVAKGVGAAVVQLKTPLRVLGRGLARLPLLPYASRFSGWLWELEMRWLRYEWAAFQHLAALAAGKAEAVLGLLLHFVSVLCRNTGRFLTRYGRTSFSIHLVVTVLQSLLLLVAMRNEMTELIEAEQRRAISPHSPLRFLKRLFPQRVEHYLPLQSITARVNGFVLLVRAHHQACMHYLLLHSIGLLVLIGLSVLPFTSKLYSLSLRYVLPWLSAKAFLVFFDDVPSSHVTVVLVVVRMLLATALQQTIGDFLYRIVKDCLIALGLFGGLTLVLWAWPQRTALAKQVATAIADSLQGTPMPSPAREEAGGDAALADAAAAAAATTAGKKGVPSQTASNGEAERVDAGEDSQQSDGVQKAEKEVQDSNGEEEDAEKSVAKKIDLSEAS